MGRYFFLGASSTGVSRSTTSAGSSGVVTGCGSSAASEIASSGAAAPASSAAEGPEPAAGAGVGTYDDCQLSLCAAALELLGDEADRAGERGEDRELLELAALLLLLLALQLRDLRVGGLLGLGRDLLARSAPAATSGAAWTRASASAAVAFSRAVGDVGGGLVTRVGQRRAGLLLGVDERRAGGVLVEVLRGVERRRDGRLHLRADLVDVVRRLVEQGLASSSVPSRFLFSADRWPGSGPASGSLAIRPRPAQGAATVVRLATRARIDGHAQRGPPGRYPLARS